MKRKTIGLMTAALLVSGCAAVSEEGEMKPADIETVIWDNDMNAYVYARREVLNGSDSVPLILYMCGTGCDPQKQPVESGFEELARKEDIIIVSPDYHNGSTYSETERLASFVKNMIEKYPVDASRVYSVGFSNGGAASVALTSEYPELFAGIAAYGWMVDMRHTDNDYEMPFLVVQGSNEFTETDEKGSHKIMSDEQKAVRSLFLYDHMITADVQPDYADTPYWGYKPDDTYEEVNDGTVWTINDYQKEGFQSPFARLILVDGAEHVPHAEEAEYTWDFLQHFSRDETGRIIERKC